MSRVWRHKENLRVNLYITISDSNSTFNITNLDKVSKMINVLVSVLTLIAAVSVTYLLTIIDSIVHNQLYQFNLTFSYDWANPYWMVLRLSLALLGLIAFAASMNIAHFFWKRMRKPEVVKSVAKEEAEVTPQRAGAPSLFQCTSCGRSITHPLRILDFHSERPKMINTCPFCNAAVIPASYTHTDEETSPAGEIEGEEEKIKKRINKGFGV